MTDSDAFIVRCVSCRTKNKIPSGKIGADAGCGRCGNRFSTDFLKNEVPVTVTDDTFEELVIRSPLPVLLDCWAPWCGPCKMMEPLLTALAAQWRGRARICKLNVDENPRISGQFQISSIPTLMIYENGGQQDTLHGAVPKNRIVSAMTPYLY